MWAEAAVKIFLIMRALFVVENLDPYGGVTLIGEGGFASFTLVGRLRFLYQSASSATDSYTISSSKELLFPCGDSRSFSAKHARCGRLASPVTNERRAFYHKCTTRGQCTQRVVVLVDQATGKAHNLNEAQERIII